MRHWAVLVCALSIPLVRAQTNTPDPGWDSNLRIVELSLLSIRPIPDASAPQFDDPLNREDQRRTETLYADYIKIVQAAGTPPQDYFTGLPKYFQDRIDKAAAQYGASDARHITALEDAALVLRGRDPKAISYLDQAIRLREHEGPNSLDYWKELQRRCTAELLQPKHDPSSCQRALELRSQQADATPLELAFRTQFLGQIDAMSGNQQKSEQDNEKSLELFAKAGAAPLYVAVRYRYLTSMSLLSADSQRILRLNDATNQSLGLAGASARDLIVPTETLKIIEDLRHSPAPASAKVDPTFLYPADQILSSYAQADRALKTARLDKSFVFDALAFRSFTLAVTNFDRQKACANMDTSSASIEMSNAVSKSQGNLDFSLASVSAEGFATTSIIQYTCASFVNQANATSIPGYATMIRWKGRFTEIVAPRSLTVLPGQGKGVTDSIQAITAARDNFAATAQQYGNTVARPQQPFANLSPEERQKYTRAFASTQPGQAMTAWVDSMRNAGQAIREQRNDNGDIKPMAVFETLKPDEAFVDFYKYRSPGQDHFGPEEYLAVISRASGPFRQVRLGRAEPIDAAIQSYLSGFVGGQSRGFSRVVNTANHAADPQALQKLLLQPILDVLPAGAAKILVSPDSSLALVPFESLLLEMGKPFQLSIVPSAYDLARLRAKPAPASRGQALLVGALDYGTGKGDFRSLPGTQSELKAVGTLAAAAQFQTVTLSGSQATRKTILEDMRQSQLLHLATHGFWETPGSKAATVAFRSAGLALSMANTQSPESLLTAEDIVHLDLSGVQLVTLSACTTGQGRPVEGQGLLGFQTAFMAAGARSLLLSLWNVPDEATARLMQSFYKTLWQNPTTSKSAALRQAQEELRADPKFADPKNWAAWVLVGEAW